MARNDTNRYVWCRCGRDLIVDRFTCVITADHH